MLYKPALATVLALSPVALAAPVEERQEPCQAVRVFLARGTSEPYPGRQSKIVSAVCDGISSCGYEDIKYPASFDPTYCASVAAGVKAGTAQLTAYAARCPNSKLVLTGYSQGGHLVGDILGGGGGTFQGCTQPTNTGLDPTTSPGNKIVAALLFGDVRHAGNQPYNTGTGSSGSGTYGRTGAQLASLNHFSNVLRSWCLAGDNVCNSGGRPDPTAHTSYFNIFSLEAGAWVKTKL